jgi:hypothetical protein
MLADVETGEGKMRSDTTDHIAIHKETDLDAGDPAATARLSRIWIRRPTKLSSHLCASAQCLSGVDDDRRFARVVIVLCDRVRRVFCGRALLVDTLNRAVAYGAAIVPCHFRTHRDRLERSSCRCSHGVFSKVDRKSALRVRVQLLNRTL